MWFLEKYKCLTFYDDLIINKNSRGQKLSIFIYYDIFCFFPIFRSVMLQMLWKCNQTCKMTLPVEDYKMASISAETAKKKGKHGPVNSINGLSVPTSNIHQIGPNFRLCKLSVRPVRKSICIMMASEITIIDSFWCGWGPWNSKNKFSLSCWTEHHPYV